MNKEQICQTCKFWKHDGTTWMQHSANNGYCRFNPPVGRDGFPWSEARDWCGKWQANIEE